MQAEFSNIVVRCKPDYIPFVIATRAQPKAPAMFNVKAYATEAQDQPLGPFSVERRDPGPHDVQIDILYCGVCHSDLHQARGDWGNSLFPMVPGHEIIGR